MPLSLKELIVVLILAAAIFTLARPTALHFMSAQDFSRRRNAWYALTSAAFLTPNFWLFALVAIPVLIAVGRKDSNPAALYVMLLQVIPPIAVPVPMIGMPFLFYIDNYLLLSFCVMTPAALQLLRSKQEDRIRGLQAMDYFLLGYSVLTVFLYIHIENPSGGLYPATYTDFLRRAFLSFFGVYVPYFAISRSPISRRALTDILATFCLSCAPLAAIALFESARRWLIYAEMGQRWGYPVDISSYLTRGTSLRAMASAGHPLALGLMFAIAFGFWLYLRPYAKSKASGIATAFLFWLGLFAAYSRGPWFAAVLIYFVFAALRPNPFSGLLKSLAVGAIATVVISLTPLGEKVINVLPFLGGTIDVGNLTYRERLLDRAWEVIQESPILGDPAALLKLQDLRQGQGIIDLVNTYLQVLLGNGFVGLWLFLSFILIALFQAWKVSRQRMPADPEFGMLGASLVACILGMLLLMVSGSFGGITERLFYVIGGLAAAYAHLGRSRMPSSLQLTTVA